MSNIHSYFVISLVRSFIIAHKLRYLSVPPYISTGRHMLNSKDFRFLVMPRFGTDLQKYLVQSGGHFSPKTTFAIGLRMVYFSYLLFYSI